MKRIWKMLYSDFVLFCFVLNHLTKTLKLRTIGIPTGMNKGM